MVRAIKFGHVESERVGVRNTNYIEHGIGDGVFIYCIN